MCHIDIYEKCGYVGIEGHCGEENLVAFELGLDSVLKFSLWSLTIVSLYSDFLPCRVSLQIQVHS